MRTTAIIQMSRAILVLTAALVWTFASVGCGTADTEDAKAPSEVAELAQGQLVMPCVHLDGNALQMNLPELQARVGSESLRIDHLRIDHLRIDLRGPVMPMIEDPPGIRFELACDAQLGAHAIGEGKVSAEAVGTWSGEGPIDLSGTVVLDKYICDAESPVAEAIIDLTVRRNDDSVRLTGPLFIPTEAIYDIAAPARDLVVRPKVDLGFGEIAGGNPALASALEPLSDTIRADIFHEIELDLDAAIDAELDGRIPGGSILVDPSIEWFDPNAPRCTIPGEDLFDQMIADADLFVHGRVLRNTVEQEPDGQVVTYTTLATVDTLKYEQTRPKTLSIRQAGGIFEGLGVTTPDYAHFRRTKRSWSC